MLPRERERDQDRKCGHTHASKCKVTHMLFPPENKLCALRFRVCGKCWGATWKKAYADDIVIYHYNQPLSNRSSPAVYFFYVPLVSIKSFSVGSEKHNQTTCCFVIHGHLKLLEWYSAQLSSSVLSIKMLLWDYRANASHIESDASYETSFGQPAHFYTLGIFLHETNPNDNNWTDESLPKVWNPGLQKWKDAC